MKKYLHILLMFISLSLSGQGYYVLELTDKDAGWVDNCLSDPDLILSQKSQNRRLKYNIELDASDVPIEKYIFSDAESLGIEVLSSSKWLNLLYVKAFESQIQNLQNYPWLKSVKNLSNSTPSSGNINQKTELRYKKTSSELKSDVFLNQVQINYLHDLGYTGKGVSIAVLDAGFTGVDNTDPFAYIRSNAKIKGVYNFIENNGNVYSSSSHGTMVLSALAAKLPSFYTGAACDSDYWLFVTEDIGSETPLEEFYWIEAAEYADSVGVDIINTSLGYSEYDLPFRSYTYEDLNGEISYISKAADISVSKGIISVNSQGNSGNSAWKYLVTPADSKNVISVGGVDAFNDIYDASSYGPTTDGRIKPEVCAMAVALPVFNSQGSLVGVNGTSGASPIISGGISCLLQAFPDISPAKLKETLISTASMTQIPDNRFGFGIANFKGAFELLEEELSKQRNDIESLKVKNPFSDYIEFINSRSIIDFNYEIYNLDGRVVKQGIIESQGRIDFRKYNSGQYFLKIYNSDSLKVFKLIKI